MNTSSFRPFGTWLKDSWQRYRQGFSLYAQLGGMMVLANVPTFFVNPQDGVNGMQAILAWVWSIAIGVPTIIAIIYAVADGSQHGTFEAYYKKSFSSAWSFIWVQILVGLIGFVGFLLLVIPGIIWAVQYSFSGMVAVLEGKRGMEALRQSKAYVKGNWWKLFFRCVGLAILVTVAVLLLIAVLGPLAEVLVVFLYPLFVSLAFFLYQDLKSIKPAHVPPQEQVAQPVS